jgi:hypothetical protein
VNIDSLPQLSYPSSPPNDRDSTLTGLHQEVTNEKIGVLEATQLATDTKFGTMEASVARIDNSHDALLGHFNELMTR